ncbi:aminodeoxychorismate/anthranilate synthase component II [Idiomarina seosinensis]|uniref:anthranilate synthase component II n=1 Tax=Idiomarina seosinensis TaxID=281739 RepID=UPI00384E1C8D
MIALIDNYDSFSHNLARYLAELGAKVVVFRNDQVSLDELRQKNIKALVISPGPCTPDQSGVSLQAIEYFAGRVPVLGVCLGHQAIAQVFGGLVVQAKRVMHGKISNISHNGQGLFAGLEKPLTVTRYHSLIIEPESLAPEFVVDSWVESAEFGYEIMAIRHQTWPVFGVQFHPESVMTKQGHQLLQNFLSVI